MAGTKRGHIGKLRIEAAKLLQKHFPEWDVQPEDIRPATGRWRSDWRMDVYRWELFTETKKKSSRGDGLPICCGCWQRLTDFVKWGKKYGITYDPKSDELDANEPPVSHSETSPK